MLLMPIGVVIIALIVVGILAAVRRPGRHEGRARPDAPTRLRHEGPDRPDAPTRPLQPEGRDRYEGSDQPDAPTRLLQFASRWLPVHRRDWGRAMLAELAHVPPGPQRWGFALAGLRVVVFPPGVATARRLAGAVLVAGLGLGAGLATHAVLPQMQVFASAFVLLAGWYATVVLTRPATGTPRRRRPGIGAGVALGVTAVITLAVYAAATYPAAAADPTHAFSVVLAAVLAVYLWLALTPPGPVGAPGPAPWLGVAAVAVSLPLWLVDALATHSPTWFTALVWLGTSALIGVAAVLAGRRAGTPLAGLQVGVVAGLPGGLLLFTGGMIATLVAARNPITDAVTLSDFHRSNLPDVASYLVSDNMGGLISMLVLVPVWTTLLGALGGAVGSSLSPTQREEPRWQPLG